MTLKNKLFLGTAIFCLLVVVFVITFITIISYSVMHAEAISEIFVFLMVVIIFCFIGLVCTGMVVFYLFKPKPNILHSDTHDYINKQIHKTSNDDAQVSIPPNFSSEDTHLESYHRHYDEKDKSLQISLSKLEAVTQNYKGVVWSVDKNLNITLYRGQFLKKIGVTPDFLEGKNIELARKKHRHMDIIDTVERTFKGGGAEEFVGDIDGRTFRTNTTPMYDNAGNIIGVVGSTDDITEEQALKNDLKNALEDAEIANKTKSSFLANMSHEIRTPMNAILGIAEIELQRNHLTDEAREAFGRIYNSGDLLLGIINDILDMSKLEAGKMEINAVKYDVPSLINDTVHLNKMKYQNKPIGLALSVSEDTPSQLYGDDLRIKQVLNNLISNAYKYTETGEIRITVSIEKSSKTDQSILVFGIKDTGIGMTKEQVDTLFEEYARFNLEANRNIQGTGLGMSIVYRIMQLMNGEILVDSEKGIGTEILLKIPQGKINDDVIGKELARNLETFNVNFISKLDQKSIVRKNMTHGTVLVVDDVESNIYVATGLMNLYQLAVDSAMSGQEALDKMNAGNIYDIIFMDHMMPDMDGIEATQMLRAQGYEGVIVALTANAVIDQEAIFIQNGFDDFISKPIDSRRLDDLLNKYIKDDKILNPAKDADTVPDPKKETELHIDERLAAAFIRDAKKSLASLDDMMKRTSYTNEEDLKNYIIHTHGLKSALANIGILPLSENAKQLESAGRAREFETIKNKTPNFMMRLCDVITALETQFSHESKAIDKNFLNTQLLKISEAVENNQKKAAKAVLSELNHMTKTQEVQTLLDELSELLLHSEFEMVKQRIVEYTARE